MRNPQERNTQRGFAIITSLLIVALATTYLMTGTMQSSSAVLGSLHNQIQSLNETRAEAGVDWAFQATRLQTIVYQIPYDTNQDGSVSSQLLPDGTGPTVRVLMTSLGKTPNQRDLWSLAATSPATGGTDTQSVAARLETETIANYTMFSLNEQPTTIWKTGHKFYGDVHSNDPDGFTFDDSPEFHNGVVSTTASSYTCYDGTCAPVVDPPGIVYNASRKTMPKDTDAKTFVESAGTIFQGDVTVTLSMRVEMGVEKTWVDIQHSSGSTGGYLGETTSPYGTVIAASGGTMTVRGAAGVLDGRIFLAAINGNVNVENNNTVWLKCDPTAPSDPDCGGISGSQNDDWMTVAAIRGNVKLASTATASKAIGFSLMAWDDPNNPGTKGEIQVENKGGGVPGIPSFEFYGISMSSSGWVPRNGVGTWRKDTRMEAANYGWPFITDKFVKYVTRCGALDPVTQTCP